jgi:hypothetical protein
MSIVLARLAGSHGPVRLPVKCRLACGHTMTGRQTAPSANPGNSTQIRGKFEITAFEFNFAWF